MGFPCGSEGKASARNAGDQSSIPGSGRFPGEGNGNPLQYCCLENPLDGGAWWATVHRVANSWTQFSDFTSLHTFLQNDQIILCHYEVCLVEWTGKEASRNYVLWPHTYFSHQLFFPSGLHHWVVTSPWAQSQRSHLGCVWGVPYLLFLKDWSLKVDILWLT